MYSTLPNWGLTCHVKKITISPHFTQVLHTLQGVSTRDVAIELKANIKAAQNKKEKRTKIFFFLRQGNVIQASKSLIDLVVCVDTTCDYWVLCSVTVPKLHCVYRVEFPDVKELPDTAIQEMSLISQCIHIPKFCLYDIHICK